MSADNPPSQVSDGNSSTVSGARKPAFVVCGQALFDFFHDATGQLATGSIHFDARVGGAPFNVARALAKLGVPTALCAGISNDFLGNQLLANMQTENLSTEFITQFSAPTTVNLVLRGADGSPQHLLRSTGAAERQLRAIDLPETLDGVYALHFGGYTLVTPPAADTYLALARRENGRRLVSLDPNIRLAVEPDIAIWRHRMLEFQPYADIIKLNREEIVMQGADRPPVQIAAEWLRTGSSLVAITDGAHGAEAWTANAHVSVPSLPIDVVDTLGAGDTFQAALLYSLYVAGCHTRADIVALGITELAEILQFANAAASITCRRRGMQPPTLAQVAELRASFGDA